MKEPLTERIFNITGKAEFSRLALDIFRFQARENEIYRTFVEALNVFPGTVTQLDQIPFMPVEFFKNHHVASTAFVPQIVFSSSGTTGMERSSHPVKEVAIYEESFVKGFEHFYGPVKDYTILALLPSYLEREGSSLIYMVDELIKRTETSDSGYYLYEHEQLYRMLLRLKTEKRKVLLIGVTYALLDLIEKYTIDFPDLIVMETGGMKGKRKEIIRDELHELLCKGFGVLKIHSEYGMTELLSQAYSMGDGIFACPPWLSILTRDVNDPLSWAKPGTTGGVNIIDLANIHSCAFIATQDLGKVHTDGTFEIAGRFDNSDIRGCNLLVQ